MSECVSECVSKCVSECVSEYVSVSMHVRVRPIEKYWRQFDHSEGSEESETTVGDLIYFSNRGTVQIIVLPVNHFNPQRDTHTKH